MLTGSADGIVRVIGILPNKMLGVVGEHGDMPVERMALSLDRTSLATASHDHTIKLWDVKDLFEEGGGPETFGGDGDGAGGEPARRAGGAAVDEGDESDESDSEGGGGKRKRKNKEKKSKMAGSGEARAAAKKQAAKKFFDGL